MQPHALRVQAFGLQHLNGFRVIGLIPDGGQEFLPRLSVAAHALKLEAGLVVFIGQSVQLFLDLGAFALSGLVLRVHREREFVVLQRLHQLAL